jgi:hypothetical protein
MKYWLAGLATCAVGLILARLVSPAITTPLEQLGIFILGSVLCFAGLGIIIVGIRKKPGKAK